MSQLVSMLRSLFRVVLKFQGRLPVKTTQYSIQQASVEANIVLDLTVAHNDIKFGITDQLLLPMFSAVIDTVKSRYFELPRETKK